MQVPIVRHPPRRRELPLVVSIPHWGTLPPPGHGPGDYHRCEDAHFARGFADLFAAELYTGLERLGATVLATPLSRLFVDLNRSRDDFEDDGGRVWSRLGVVRTHTRSGRPIFSAPLTRAEVERRLERYYEPYYRRLGEVLAERHARHGRVLLVDAHTGSPKRMREAEVVLGTRRGATCDPALARRAAGVLRRHGFAPRHDVPGYAGGNIVRTFGRPTGGVHAIQLEVSSALLTTVPHPQVVDRLVGGRDIELHHGNVARLRACLRELLPDLAAALPA